MSDRDEARLVLRGKHRGPAVPTRHAELDREVYVEPGASVDGSVLGGRVLIAGPKTTVTGPVYGRRSLNIKPAGGRVFLGGGAIARQAVLVEPSAQESGWTSIVGDVHADRIRLHRTLVFGAVFGRSVSLEHSAVLGGAFARGTLNMTSSLVSTFQAGTCQMNEGCLLLFLGGTASDEVIVRRPVKCLQFIQWNWLLDSAEKAEGGSVQLTQEDVEPTGVTVGDQRVVMQVLGVGRRVMATASWQSILQSNRERLSRLLARRHLAPREQESLPPLSAVESSLMRFVFPRNAKSGAGTPGAAR